MESLENGSLSPYPIPTQPSQTAYVNAKACRKPREPSLAPA